MRQALRDDVCEKQSVEEVKFRKRPKAKAKSRCKAKGSKEAEEESGQDDDDDDACELDAEDRAVRNQVDPSDPDPVGRKGAGRGRRGAGGGRSGRGRSCRKRACPTENVSWLNICNMCNAITVLLFYVALIL